jgi:hypothetical protein
LKTKFGGKKQRESGDVCGLERERERGGRFVIKKKKEKERRAEEEEKESKRSRGERAAFGQIQVSTSLSVFEASFERKASIHVYIQVSPALGLARSRQVGWTDGGYFLYRQNNYITIILFYFVMEVTITMYLIKSNGGYIF